MSIALFLALVLLTAAAIVRPLLPGSRTTHPLPASLPRRAPLPHSPAVGQIRGLECPTCGTPIRPGDNFCVSCGGSLEAPGATCAACGAPMDEEDQFCRRCGTVSGIAEVRQ